MADIEIRVEVVLCPDEKLEKMPPDGSWPRYPGLKVHFQKSGAAAGDDAVTNADGLATSPELSSGDYEVSVDTPALPAGWTVKAGEDPLHVPADQAGQRQRITLIPLAGYRLLPLRLRSEELGGTPEPLPGAEVSMEALGEAKWSEKFQASGKGWVYALVPHERPKGKPITSVRLTFQSVKKDGRTFEPAYEEITFGVPAADDPLVEKPAFIYAPAEPQHDRFRGISVKPRIRRLSGNEAPLTGAKVSVRRQGTTSGAAEVVGTLAPGEDEVRFPNLEHGVYIVTVTPPESFESWPVTAGPKQDGPHYLRADEAYSADVEPFGFEQINLLVKTPDDRPLDHDLRLVIYGPDGSAEVTSRSGKLSAPAPSKPPLKIKLASGAPPAVAGIPLEMEVPGQGVGPPSQVTEVNLVYQHGVFGRAVDDSGRPMPGAVIVLYDGGTEKGRAVADKDGNFIAGLEKAGSYSIAIQTEGGQPVSQRLVSVQSVVNAGDVVYRHWEPLDRGGSHQDRNRQDTSGAGRDTREAFTDLAAYPVLTEEITTTGPPAPAGGAPGGAGADYGQVVGQVMRDVLGWRPSADVSGFQAALTGAFQLYDVEGHTEWTWQQRGYAVQADMGALTGAQASIYARAKAAVDQIQPLLAGLISLDPSLYPPQDLETIRTVVAAEFNELVSELGLAGGPRLQRVDELFDLLLGEEDHLSMNPDRVRGQLGLLRDRFGLKVTNVQTIDEERIVTNFRVIVDQVLALDASWQADRSLFSRDVFSGKASKTSFGTTLIWLSRSLEAVVESVDDLNFALDSVFVDAAQRQVIELRFEGTEESPIILSDLLEWVVRACGDEGPRIIQDAGKDGVVAFSTVLDKLRTLVHETIRHALKDGRLPQGMKTPRVDRAFKVLDKQLQEAADLARSVRQGEAPHIDSATPQVRLGKHGGLQMPVQPQVPVQLIGRNFRAGARTVFTPDGSHTGHRADRTEVVQPGFAVAIFSGTWMYCGIHGTLVLTNEDGTESNPKTVTFD